MITHAKLSLNYGSYDSLSSDNYLEMICNIFDDGGYWTESVKKCLLDSECPGLTGNKTDLNIIANMIIISPLYADNPEEFAIEIDRKKLLDLINQWEVFANQKSPEIYLIRYEDGSIEITDRLPNE